MHLCGKVLKKPKRKKKVLPGVEPTAMEIDDFGS